MNARKASKSPARIRSNARPSSPPGRSSCSRIAFSTWWARSRQVGKPYSCATVSFSSRNDVPLTSINVRARSSYHATGRRPMRPTGGSGSRVSTQRLNSAQERCPCSDALTHCPSEGPKRSGARSPSAPSTRSAASRSRSRQARTSSFACLRYHSRSSRAGSSWCMTIPPSSLPGVRLTRAERGRLVGRAIRALEVGTSLPADRRRPRAPTAILRDDLRGRADHLREARHRLEQVLLRAELDVGLETGRAVRAGVEARERGGERAREQFRRDG